MPPQRRWAPALAALPILLALVLDPIAGLTAPARAEPVARMGHLIDVERSLGAFFEPSLHAWVAARPPLLHMLDVTYLGVHVPLTLAVLAWVWVARRDAFPFARNAFVAAQTLSALGYLLAPTAPPRMVRGLGYSISPGPGDHGLGRLVQSPYAAMPSAHTAFALVTAGVLFALARSRRVRVLALLYPLAVVAEILATGNHIWLDAVGGAIAAALAFGLALWLRARSGSRPPEAAPELAPA